MFYSEAILSSKGPLAKVWLAAHMEKKLSKAQLLQTDLKVSIVAIRGDDQPPMALRLSGQLLLGVVRIYSRKTKYLLDDCNEANLKLKMAFRPGVVDLPADQLLATLGSITLPDAVSDFALLLPDPDYSTKQWEQETQAAASQTISRPQDITMKDSFSFDASASLLRQTGLDDFAMPDDGVDLQFDDDGFGAFLPNISPGIEVGRDTAQLESPALNLDGDRPLANTITPKSLLNGEDLLGEDITGLNQITMGSIGSDIGLPTLSGMPANLDMAGFTTGPNGIDLSMPLFRQQAGQTRKRKLLIDNAIEIDQNTLSSQLKNTSDITIDDELSPVNKRLQGLIFENPSVNDYMSLDGPPNLVPELLALFSRVNLEENQTHDQADQTQDMGNGFNDFDAGMDTFQDLPHQGEGSIVDSLLEPSMFFGDIATQEEIEIEDAQIPTASQPETQRSKIAQTTLRAIQLIKENMKARSSKKCGAAPSAALFSDIAGPSTEATRSDAVKLFFEMLVLNNKNVVEVKQSEPYGEMEIHGKDLLFDESSPYALGS